MNDNVKEKKIERLVVIMKGIMNEKVKMEEKIWIMVEKEIMLEMKEEGDGKDEKERVGKIGFNEKIEEISRKKEKSRENERSEIES